jgi:TonB-dependent starch-binding outer membrane protein SusC
MKFRKLITALLLPLFFLLLANASFAQKTITGKVTDMGGNGLSGVTVAAKGANAATATNDAGQFSITVPASTTMLVFSSVGYGTQEYTIGTNNSLNVSLSPLAGNLNEVVVVGYGTQRRKDVTGSVTTVSTKDFNKGLITTPEQLIQGKVAGVQVTSSGGAPGSGSVIRIRGGASLNASNDPLIVIDGVPVSNAGVAGSANILNTINPNDIESFNVLKDASATAIYGSRASNGVILITTKKGTRSDKFHVNFSSTLSNSRRTDAVDVLSADELRTYVNSKGTTAQKAMLGNANTNWQDLIFRDAWTTEQNLGFNGGFKPLPYRASFGYLDQDGILKTSNMKRATGSLGLFPSLFDNHLNIIVNVKGTRTENRFADEGAISNAINFDPTQPVYQKNGPGGYFEWLDAATGKPLALSNRNPVALLDLVQNNSVVKRALGNVQFDYKLHFFPDVKLNLNLGYDKQQGSGSVMIPAYAATQRTQAYRDTSGTGNKYAQENTNKLLEFYANYSKDLTKIKSRVDFIAGYSYQDFLYEQTNFPGFGYKGDTIPNSKPIYPKNINEQTLLSYYGRLNYVFMEKYIFTATLRRDASSIFSDKNRWGTFPAVALAWRLKDESFLKDSRIFSDLKLRAGYGITGQQDITGVAGFYPYIPGYFLSDSSSMYQFGNTYYSTYSPKAYNSELKWEETETINLGLDFGFLKGRLNGTFDVFRKTSRDLLAVVAYPVSTNFTNEFIKNIGSFEAKGVELGINATPVKTKDFNWNLGFNATYVKKLIKKLNDVNNPDFAGYQTGGISGGTGNRIQIHSVGYAPNAFYVYQQVYDAAGHPIEGLYADLNRDGIINEKDLYRYKSRDPKLTMGFNSQLGYKKLTLSFSLRSNIGNYMYSNLNSSNGVSNNILPPFAYLANATTDFNITRFGNNQYFSDYYVSNASFLKMDYLTLGYNLGKIWSNKIGVRLNASVQNVFTVTKYKGLDPEIFSGIDNQMYPRPRTYSLGINLDY